MRCIALPSPYQHRRIALGSLSYHFNGSVSRLAAVPPFLRVANVSNRRAFRAAKRAGHFCYRVDTWVVSKVEKENIWAIEFHGKQLTFALVSYHTCRAFAIA